MANLVQAPVTNEFQTAFDSWFEGCKKLIADYDDRIGYIRHEELTFTVRKRYIFVFRHRDGWAGGSSAWAFVDIKTGDVLKPASWKSPAKHARGNIFDESNGLRKIGPYGPAYLS